MPQLPWTCRRRPSSAKIPAAFSGCPPRPVKFGRNFLIMTQPLAGLTFSDADRAEVGSILSTLYRECLAQLRSADRLREAAGVPLPAEAASLYAYLLPRQVTQR